MSRKVTISVNKKTAALFHSSVRYTSCGALFKQNIIVGTSVSFVSFRSNILTRGRLMFEEILFTGICATKYICQNSFYPK